MLSISGFAQTEATSSQTSGSPEILAEYQQGQWALGQQYDALLSQGATLAQLEAWQQQNAPQFEAQVQLLQTLSLASALQPLPVVDSVIIPPGASATLGDFITGQAGLANSFAQINNQLLQSLPPGATQQDVNSMQVQEQQIFRQQDAGSLQLQAQLGQTLAAESASNPIPVPGPALIPPNATPQLRAFLTARDALAATRAQVWNQYLTADPATREAAMRQWQQQNAAVIRQLDQLAQDLANSTATQEGNNP